MEDNIMDLIDEEADAETAPIVVYLFIWDRFRMIAKDFTLMNSALGVNVIWIECHERMARWYVYMDHRMKCEEDYVKAGHGQQNGESLNNIFKTLVTIYSIAEHCAIEGPLHTPNKGELVGYFILFQIGNKGEMTKFLQQLDDDYFESRDVQFAIKVWRAIKAENYIAFFQLLRSATLLQACMMHKYVSEVRVLAIAKMCKSYAVPGSITMPCYFPLSTLADLLMFEDLNETREFVEHCGFEIEDEELEDGPCILLENQNIYNSLEVDKNNNPILPVARYMWNGIESKRLIPAVDGDEDADQLVPLKDICRGYLSAAAERFDDDSCLKNGALGVPSRPSSRPDSRSDGMLIDDQNRNREDEYELSSQDSDDDIMVAPFPHLSRLRKSPSKPLSPPVNQELKMKKNDAESPEVKTPPSLALPILNSPRALNSIPSENHTSPHSSPSYVNPGVTQSLSPVKSPTTYTSGFLPFGAATTEAAPSANVSLKKTAVDTPFSIRSPLFSSPTSPLPLLTKSSFALEERKPDADVDKVEQLREQEKLRLEEEKRKEYEEKQEALKQQQELQLAMQREAEECRLLHIENERIQREKEAIEQRKLEEERLTLIARREEERSQQLELLLQRYLSRKSQILKAQVFDILFDYAVKSATNDYHRELLLFWNRWKASLTQTVKLREQFSNDLRSISIAPSGTTLRGATVSSLKKRKHLVYDDHVYERRKYVREGGLAVGVDESASAQLFSFNDALRLRAAQLISIGKGFDCYLPLNLPTIFGPSLFRFQSQRVRQYRGYRSEDYSSDNIAFSCLGNEAIWNNDLFLKVAVASQSACAGKWNINDDEAINIIRLILCTHAESDSSDVIGKWNESINCSNDNRPVYRNVRIAVVDVGKDYSVYKDQKTLDGTQIIILVLSLHNQGEWKYLPFMQELKRRFQSSRFIVILTSFSRSNQISFVDLKKSAHDNNFGHNHQLNEVASCFAVSRTELLQSVSSLYELSYGSMLDDSTTLICKSCLANAFENIIKGSQDKLLSFPLIQRFEAADWIRDSLSSAIWQSATMNGFIDDRLSNMNALIVDKVSDCMKCCERLLSDHEYSRHGFPTLEFASDQGKQPVCVSRAIFENLSGSNIIDIPCNWSSDEYFQSPIRNILDILRKLGCIFNRNEQEFWDLISDQYADLYHHRDIRNHRYSLQRLADKILERTIASLSHEVVIISIPENVTDATNPVLSVWNRNPWSSVNPDKENIRSLDDNIRIIPLVESTAKDLNNDLDEDSDDHTSSIRQEMNVEVVNPPKKDSKIEQLERFVAEEIGAGQELIDSLLFSLRDDQYFERERSPVRLLMRGIIDSDLLY